MAGRTSWDRTIRPVATAIAFAAQSYPSQCGDPNATCVGNTANCVNAYFYPMYDPPENKYAPNSVCLGAQTPTTAFLPGS